MHQSVNSTDLGLCCRLPSANNCKPCCSRLIYKMWNFSGNLKTNSKYLLFYLRVEYFRVVLRGTTVLRQHRGTIFLRYLYRRLYGTFWYRNTTSTAVLRHGTGPLLTHSNERLLDCILYFDWNCNFRLVFCHSPLNCTHFTYLFCCFVVN